MKKEYTGHYQEDSRGGIRHLSSKKVEETAKKVKHGLAKSKALEGAKSGGLIGKLKSQIAESEKARSGNWRDLLGKK